jgi:hypothetical protein
MIKMFRFTPLLKSMFPLDLHAHARFDELKMIIADKPTAYTPKQVYDIVKDCILNEFSFYMDYLEDLYSLSLNMDSMDYANGVKQVKEKILDPEFMGMVANQIYEDINQNNINLELPTSFDDQEITVWARRFLKTSITFAGTYVINSKKFQKSMSFNVPQAVRNAAKRGLELRRENKRGGLSNEQASNLGIGSGVQRAVNLSEGKVSLQTLKRMKSFFARHRVYKEKGYHKDQTSASYISWLLWGGDAGDAWATRTLEQIEKKENQNEN